MRAKSITKEDLRSFKQELLEEFKKLIKDGSNIGNRKYLKSQELMKILNISSNTLQTLRINGTLPFTKIGGIIYYDAEEVDKVIKENSVHNKF